jgi:hypothetical protein
VNQVAIDGTPEVVGAARARPDVIPIQGEELEDGRVRLFAYVTTPAIAAVEALGATVEVIQTEAERAAGLEELYALLEEDEPPLA